MNQAGTETYFDRPPATEAMTYWHDFAASSGASPPGETAWPTLSPDFLHGNAAVIQHTTGNLTNVRKEAQLPVRRRLAARQDRAAHRHRRRQHLHLQERQPGRTQAALRFARWVSTPGARRRLVDPHRLRRDPAGCVRHAGAAAITSPSSRRRRSARDGLPIATGELSTL